MQMWKPVSFLLLCVACEGVTLQAHSAQQQDAERAELSELAAERKELVELEADDHRFWAAALAAQESELMKLQASVEKKASTPPGAIAATRKTVATNSSFPTPFKNHSEHRKSPLTGLKLNLNPKSKTDLVPALAMLKGLYEDGKERIAHLNAREKVSKTRFASQESRHKERLDRIKSRLANHTMRAEFATNETIEENRQFKYWQGVREREHRQFHTSLKIQHGTMSKEKEMVDMYEKTIAGTADEKSIKTELAGASGGMMPDVVFVQEEAKRFCYSALAEVRAARADLNLGVGVDSNDFL